MVAGLLIASCLQIVAADGIVRDTMRAGSMRAEPDTSEVHAALVSPADTVESLADAEDLIQDDVVDRLIDDDDDASATISGSSESIAYAQEMLHELAIWKLDVNDASAEALESLPWISPMDAARIASYRKKAGGIRRISELADAGLSPETIASIRPYIVIRRRRSVRLRAEVMQRWSRRITQTQGYRRDSSQTRYLGRPDAFMTRLKVGLGEHILVGATLEKDAGEPFKDTGGKVDLGHDFAAGYAVVSRFGPFHRIVVGDFSTHVGEGLLFGQGSTMGAGPKSWRVRELIRPHSSSREYGFFRGIGFHTRPLFGIHAAIALSRRSVDARLDSSIGRWIVNSTGLHRTESERSRKKKAREWMIGWMFGYHRSGFRAGIAGSATRRIFGSPANASLRELADSASVAEAEPFTKPTENVRNFAGYVSWSGPQIGLSAEVAPRDSGLAVSAAFGYAPSRSTEFWLETVHSTPGGSAPHSSIGVDSRGAARSETVWTSSLQLRPSPKWKWLVMSRWRRTPSHPMEGGSVALSGTLEAKPTPWITVRVRATDHRDESIGACVSGARLLRCSSTSRRRSFRMQIDYEHSRSLRNRFHVEVSSGKSESTLRSRGIVLYKDVRWRLSRRLQVDGRLLFFDVSDFEARIYAYENDLLYSFSAPLYTGRGRRSYVLFRISPHSAVSLQLKYSVSSYEDVDSVGSGLDATSEPTRKDVRVQIRWKIGSMRQENARSIGQRFSEGRACT